MVTESPTNLKIDVWFKILGKVNEFGAEEVDPKPNWGEKIQKVTYRRDLYFDSVGKLIDARME